MAFSSPKEVLRGAGLAPKRGFGQNFLSDRRVAEVIAATCVPDAHSGRARVVELGAGTGALTSLLLERARSVVAVERDRDLVPLLAKLFSSQIERGTLRLCEGDAQRVPLAELFGPKEESSPRVLSGNLPYQITGALLERAVHHAPFLERVVFMVQKEVAERLTAIPGSKEYGALSVFVQAAFTTRRRLVVSRSAFYPSPDVDSAVVELAPHPTPRGEETDTFRALVRAAFGQRRKTLRNAWKAMAPGIAEAAAEAGVDLDARGETLSVESFAKVASALDAAGGRL